MVALAGAARADPPAFALSAPAAEPARARLLDENLPPPPPLPPGTIAIGDRLHVVPIHVYPTHDAYLVEIDGQHGLPPLRFEVAGNGIIGGAAGEVSLGRWGRLRSTVLHTPNLIMMDVDDTFVLFRRSLPGGRQLSGGLRFGVQALNVPNLVVAQGFVQAGARLDGLIGGNRLIHFDAYAGSAALLNYNTTLEQRDGLAPGFQFSTALVIER